MLHKRTVLILILFFIIFSFGISESFSNSDNPDDNNELNKKITMIKNNTKFEIIAISQLSNEIKKDLFKKNIVIMTNILENQITPAIKFADNNKNFIPINDILIAFEQNDFEKVSPNKNSVGLNKAQKPLYLSSDNAKRDKQQKITVKNDIVVVSLDENTNEVSIEYDKNKINDKYIDFVPLESEEFKLYLVKLVDEDKKITFLL
jgi:hypothetical protein